MNINETCQQVHALAKEKGWYDQPKTPLEAHMLMVSEIAEASEEVRNSTPPIYAKIKITAENMRFAKIETNSEIIRTNLLKPEGEAIELADAIIRIFDYAAYRGFDLEAAISLKHNYNKSRSYKHGGKAL
jgi:hypothetical protein